MSGTSLPIVIAFDSDCLLCNRGIRVLAALDRSDRIRFTRLRDPCGQEMVAQSGELQLDSVLVRSGDQVLSRSSALLGILDALGGLWEFPARIGRLIPRPLRDWLYDLIASHRYQWFGKSDDCSLPSEALRKKLLP